ncbi:MAG: hypothetical protein QME60_06000 [Verrucomicrobiota bacterium]|nr:hypothetical protein [Verrucomicrobiota bacterium]
MNMRNQRKALWLTVGVAAVLAGSVQAAQTVGTSASTNAIRIYPGRYCQYANGRYWACFWKDDGTVSDAVIYSSADGTNWASQGNIFTNTPGNNHGMWITRFMENCVYAANIREEICFFRRGALENSGAVTWSDQTRTLNPSLISAQGVLGLGANDNNCPWVGLRAQEMKMAAALSTNQSGIGSWISYYPVSSSVLEGSTVGNGGVLFSLGGNNMIFTYGHYEDELSANTYDASGNTWNTSNEAIASDLWGGWLNQNYPWSVVQTTNRNLHLIYVNNAGSLHYRLRTSGLAGTWSTVTNSVTGLTSHRRAALSRDGSDNLYLFYDKNDEKIYCRKYDGSTWSTEEEEVKSNATPIVSAISCSEVMRDYCIGLTWEEGAASPYNVVFEKYTIPRPPPKGTVTWFR